MNVRLCKDSGSMAAAEVEWITVFTTPCQAHFKPMHSDTHQPPAVSTTHQLATRFTRLARFTRFFSFQRRASHPDPLQLVVAACTLALTLSSLPAHAQAPGEAPTTPTPAAAETAPAAPRYSAAEIEQAFSYIDANKDGVISREEAAGFKGVARHFDRADMDKDGTLAKAEFSNAMNQAK